MSCWTCRYQQIGGLTFLGLCLYFERMGKAARPIPETIVDSGCKFEKEREPRGSQQEGTPHGESNDRD